MSAVSLKGFASLEEAARRQLPATCRHRKRLRRWTGLRQESGPGRGLARLSLALWSPPLVCRLGQVWRQIGRSVRDELMAALPNLHLRCCSVRGCSRNSCNEEICRRVSSKLAPSAS